MLLSYLRRGTILEDDAVITGHNLVLADINGASNKAALIILTTRNSFHSKFLSLACLSTLVSRLIHRVEVFACRTMQPSFRCSNCITNFAFELAVVRSSSLPKVLSML